MEWLTKEHQVAEALRSLIAAGEWTNHLPGYRQLSSRLGVHRATLEKALQMLAQEGVVAAAEGGKRRRIGNVQPSARHPSRRSLLVAGPLPVHAYTLAQQSILTRIMQEAESAGWKVNYEYFDFSFPRKSVARMEQLARDHRPSELILMTPGAALARWAAKAVMPVFLLGGEVREVQDQISGIAVSFNDLICEAGRRLREQGHRRVLIPTAPGKEQLRSNAISASAASWAHDIPRVELEAMFAEQGEWLPDVLRGFWPKAFARLRPTAVIVKESHEYLSILSYCYLKGIHIPGELSVIQLSGDPACLWLSPTPDRFEFPVAAICRQVMRWLGRSSGPGHAFRYIAAPYVKGGTLGRCPQD